MTSSLPKQLQPALKALDKDLLARSRLPDAEAGLRREWEHETEEGQTGQGFDPWRRERVTQLAVAWILSVVFVRTLEDGQWIDPRLGGADEPALRSAEEREAIFTQLAPFLGPREYLLTVFRELAQLPGARHVFDVQHNPVWKLAPSAEGARALIDFFRKRDAEGRTALAFPTGDTRFLGDLYQDLSKEVRERYALLQTPEFVEEFILEQTLEPAIREFGLEQVRLIDPTCGSGHFLLGAFRRLLGHWRRVKPDDAVEALARKALDQVFGVDINPYAVAIARFRLVLEVMQAIGIRRLSQAPDLKPSLAVADSLLHRFEERRAVDRAGQLSFDESTTWGDALFRLENPGEVKQVLSQRYHAVVGNPPYIEEQDLRKKAQYRELYVSAAGHFALSAPFTERFFDLAVSGGFVGAINSNAWTKRDFGSALIEKVFPNLDLQKIIDTSGCYIPGHGTPTLLVFGRNRAPQGDSVLAVLGKRGEQDVPANPSSAPVWAEITSNHDRVGYDSPVSSISVELLRRVELSKHPWVLSGGGARQILGQLSASAPVTVAKVAECIGRSTHTGDDPFFIRPPNRIQCNAVQLVQGEDVRDWFVVRNQDCAFPYDQTGVAWNELPAAEVHFYWPWRTKLRSRKDFGETIEERGHKWFEHSMFFPERFRSKWSIAFAFVATHNHFVLDRGRKVFNRSAPIIQLHERFDEADHQALLGYLNSSLTGFWCRLVMFPKGGDQVGDGARLSATQWNRHLEYAGNLLQQLPVPELPRLREALLPLVVAAEETVRSMAEIAPEPALRAALEGKPTLETLRAARERMKAERARLRGILASLQEEMDWRVYGLFGFPTVLAKSVDAVRVPVAPEHRPIEVRLARDVATDISASEWFRLHQRTPPKDVGGPLAELYKKRLALIDDPERGKELRLLETPETKRRWPVTNDDQAFVDAARDWLLDRLEQVFRDQAQPELRTARQLAFELNKDPRVAAVTESLTEGTGHDLVRLVSELVDAQGVPYLAAQRHTEAGLEKRKGWEETWELQRAEDAGKLAEALAARNLKSIPVPDKYSKDDFQRHYESLRGALDVPKERFTTVPGGNSEDDPTPLVGWAGWNHLQTAQALSGLFNRRKDDDGWPKERLVPFLAGIHERVPWLLQWHDEPSDAFNGLRLGGFFRDFVAARAHELGVSTADLVAWRPQTTRVAPRARATTVTQAEVLKALAGWTGEADATPDDLAPLVGAPKTAVSKLLKALVESGEAEQTRGRPARYRAIATTSRT